MKTNMRQKGFTLVEILIVVVILGILAAIVIPQFSEASSEARESSVKSNLQMVRSQIELFKVQHNETQPGDVSGAANAVTFVAALTSKTDGTGALSDTGDYGPYVQSFPVNAYNNLATVTEGTTTPTEAATGYGWFYNTSTGDFVCPYSVGTGDDYTINW